MLVLPEFTLIQPESVEAAAEALAVSPQESMLLAGGTDLVPNMKHGLHTPRRLVCLGGIASLRQAKETAGGGLELGAGMTLAEVARHPVIHSRYSALAQAAGLVAGPQLRNRGTLGGNLCLDTRCVYYNQTHFWRQALGFCLKKDGTVCHVVPGGSRCVAAFSADTPGPLMVYEARVRLQSIRGVRELALADFFRGDGVHNTIREPDEILTTVILPPTPEGFRSVYTKLRIRESIDFPLLSLAVGGVIAADVFKTLTIVVGGLGARPRIIKGLSALAGDHGATPEVLDAVSRQVFAQCHPLKNTHPDTAWRRRTLSVLVGRALEALNSGAS